MMECPDCSLTLVCVCVLCFCVCEASFNGKVVHFFVVVGCGSGLSGETLSENGHQWVGLDISQSMLGMFQWFDCYCYPNFLRIVNVMSPCLVSCCVSMLFFLSSSFVFSFLKFEFWCVLLNLDIALEREVEGDLLLGDMGQVFWALYTWQFNSNVNKLIYISKRNVMSTTFSQQILCGRLLLGDIVSLYK